VGGGGGGGGCELKPGKKKGIDYDKRRRSNTMGEVNRTKVIDRSSLLRETALNTK